ncbi:alpha/beta fold hydrolase [Vallitalea okinawensis]|uniref:alpha/beta fold hydrolase n=1 Tax=Vallitalea okinawensis TaxID=2078660 RepID=UPI000CFDD033|nr:alpha/beta hydrolase [Vallitalea okinawensis]
MKKKIDYLTEYVNINGIDQFLLYYRNMNSDLPVLLFLHGGPGMSESTFSYAFQEEISDLYTVVHWDQRGAGKTLSKNKNIYPTINELLDDLYQVVKYLKEKYTKEKVVILGHSFGSVLGTLFVLKHPEDVLYYIGAGQVISLTENEKVGYEKLKELIIKSDNKKDLGKLKKIGKYPKNKYDKSMIKKIQEIRILQGKYKIGMDFIPILITLFKSPIFQVSDILSIVKGMSNNKQLFEYLFSHSLNDEHNYEIPVYYIVGDRDFQAPNTIAKSYFNTINAPNKEIFMIEDAGHFMMLDQPKLFAEAMTKICMLKGVYEYNY